jgi:hypothetical protein
MLRALIALTLCIGLAACGQSRLNPMNWFGGDREERITVDRGRAPRPIPARWWVKSPELAIEQTTSGAILTATALTERHGLLAAGAGGGRRVRGRRHLRIPRRPAARGATQGPEPTRVIVGRRRLGRGDLQGLSARSRSSRAEPRTVERR